MFNSYADILMNNNRKLQFLLETKLSIDDKVPKTGRLLRNKIFVIGFPPNCTENDLEQFFSNFGSIRETRIVKDENGITKGYAFITFAKERSVVHALEYRGPLYFMDRKLSINPAVKKPHQFIRTERCQSSCTSIDTPSDISNSSNCGNNFHGIALQNYYPDGGSHPFVHYGIPPHPMFCTAGPNPIWYHPFVPMTNYSSRPYVTMTGNTPGFPMVSHLSNNIHPHSAFGYTHLYGNE